MPWAVMYAPSKWIIIHVILIHMTYDATHVELSIPAGLLSHSII